MPDGWEWNHFATFSRDGTGDFDGDGVNDVWEYYLGLNAMSQDTNGDGTLDGNEDTDNDGLTNLSELLTYRTNPKIAQSQVVGYDDDYVVAVAVPEGCTVEDPDPGAPIMPELQYGYGPDPRSPMILRITAGPGDDKTVEISGTHEGQLLEVYSTESFTPPITWKIETTMYGSEGTTTLVIPRNGRTQLYLEAGSGDDDDGDGLSNGYEFGILGTD